MLIKSLCDYYDMLAKKGKTAPNGYEYVGITHTIFLKENGSIGYIANCREPNEYTDKKGKTKVKYEPKEVLFPKRVSSPKVSSEFIEHRRPYIFGLAFDNDEFHTWELKSGKKQDILKYFRKFKEDNLKFIEGIDSPIVNAYRNFMLNWNPENELNNEHLKAIGKDLKNAKFEFRLAGNVREILEEDEQVKKRWEQRYFSDSNEDSKGAVISQCGIYGQNEKISCTHNAVKGLVGGQSSGCKLVCFNNESDESYGKAQSYNSNVSEKAMRKYTEALGYIVDKNRITIDDMNIIYWSCDKESGEKCEDIFAKFFGKSENDMDSETTEKSIRELIKDAKKGNINFDKISDENLGKINEDSDFYIVGLKPNSSRIAIKFFYKNKFGKLLYNIAKHQSDIQISEDGKLVPLWQIKNTMIPEKSKKTAVDPEIIAKIFKAIIDGSKYPEMLLNNMVTRFKLSEDETHYLAQKIRAGVIKACLNRKLKNKEEFKMSLDENNKNAAYLCGRLFAILEKLQQNAASSKLNRTIKDAYFSSASSRPASIFPQILKLSNYHLAKLEDKNKIFYNKLISSIMDDISGEFPKHLKLDDQGKFIIGYYHQNSDLYKSKKEIENNYDEENEEEI